MPAVESAERRIGSAHGQMRQDFSLPGASIISSAHSGSVHEGSGQNGSHVFLPFDAHGTYDAIQKNSYNGFRLETSGRIPPTGVGLLGSLYKTNGARSGENLLISELDQLTMPEDARGLVPPVMEHHEGERGNATINHRPPFGQEKFRQTPHGLLVSTSSDLDALNIHPLPAGVEKYYLDENPRNRLDLRHADITQVHEYVESRIESLIIKASERNVELLEANPWLRDELLATRIRNRGENVTQESLLVELTNHMVNDNVQYRDKKGRNYLPYDDIQPNKDLFELIRFDWDSDSHMAAVLNSGMSDSIQRAKFMLLNAKYLFDVTGGWVPNGSAQWMDDRTQPPRHSHMLRMLWDKMTPAERLSPENQAFFNDIIEGLVKPEYWNVFNAKDPANPLSREDPLHQQLFDAHGILRTRPGGLDPVVYNQTSEVGSGKDNSRETYNRSADFDRFDLHSMLFQVENDMRWWADITGNPDVANQWQQRMAQRAQYVRDTHFDSEKGWVYHWDFENDIHSDVAVSTGITTLRMFPDPEDRKKLLGEFEERFVHAFGVGLTDPYTLPEQPPDETIASIEPSKAMQVTIKEQYKKQQWEGNNQFFNITMIIAEDLLAASLAESVKELADWELNLAIRIMEGAMTGLTTYFQRKQALFGKGRLPEKLDSKTGHMGTDALYPDQNELGMPMGAFERFAELLPIAYDRREAWNKTEGIELYVAPTRRIRQEQELAA